MMPVKLVTFDVTGTLLHFRTPVIEKYLQTGLKFGIQADAETLKKNFKTAWKTLSLEHPNFGKESGLGWRNWWTQCVEKTFDDYVKPENGGKIQTMAQNLIDYHTTKEAFTVRPGTENLLGYLKEKQIKLGVISNYDPRLTQILELMDLKNYFDFVLVSYDFGYSKPDKRIFKEALRLGSCEFENEAVHVGDDVEKDYLGARKVGMKAILMASNLEDLKMSKVDSGDVYNDFHKLKHYFESQYRAV